MQTPPERQRGTLIDWCPCMCVGLMCMGAKISDTQSETETSVFISTPFKDLLPVSLFPDKRGRANKNHKNMKAHIPLSLLRGSIEQCLYIRNKRKNMLEETQMET